MKYLLTVAASLCVSLTLCATAVAQDANPLGSVLITNANIFDGKSATLATGMSVLVEAYWTVRETDSGGEFRLSASRGEEQWDVPVDSQQGTEFVVYDRSPQLASGGDVLYRLFYKGPGEPWRMLAEQTLSLGTTVETTRLWNLYPNPARARIVIPFTIARGGQVQLTVHDVRGREVAREFEGWLQPGSRQWNWSGKNSRGVKLAAGLYVVRLVTEQGMQTRKIVLVE